MILSGFQLAEEWSSVLPLGVMLSPLVEIFSLLKLGQSTPNPRIHVDDCNKHLSKEYGSLIIAKLCLFKHIRYVIIG